MNHPWDAGSEFIMGGSNHGWVPRDPSIVHSDRSLGSASFSTLPSNSFSDFSQAGFQSYSNFSLGSDRSFSDFSEDQSFFDTKGLSMGSFTSGFAGLGVSSTIKDFNQFATNNSINQASMGRGPLGHAFDADFYAKQQADHDTFSRNLEGESIALGSAFGPEGLGVGALVAGGIEIANHFTQPSVNETPTNNGSFANGNIGNDNSSVIDNNGN